MSSDNKHDQKLQAVLLADSFTNSFRPITLDTNQPKVLCPLNNITLLDYSIEFLAGSGVEEIFVFCVHAASQVERYVQQSSWTSVINVICVKDASCANAGDALRELDKRGLVRSDPFILMSGDVVTNVDIKGALKLHEQRHKKDSTAIMTMLFQQINHTNNNSQEIVSSNAAPIRSTRDDLVVGMNPSDKRVLVFDDDARSGAVSIPCGFFTSNASIEIRHDLLDVGIYICSPEVLARFSDEFDYKYIGRDFVHYSVAEEEEGLQNKIYAHMLQSGEYGARIHDFRTYGAISKDLVRRWCYPVVPDNLPSGYEKKYRYAQSRHFVYREVKKGHTRIARSTILGKETIVGAHCHIGERCAIKGTVIGNNCSIDNGVQITNSHLWEDVVIEDNTTIIGSILCDGVIIRKGATLGTGCVIGKDCIIGTNVTLPPFTRITTCSNDAGMGDDDDGFDDGDFGDFNESDEFESSSEEEDSSLEQDANLDERGSGGMTPETPCDHEVVGNDGVGRVWNPPITAEDDSDYDSEDDDMDNYEEYALCVGNTVQAQSIGYDAAPLYQKRMEMQQIKATQEDNDEDYTSVDDNDDDDTKGGGGGGFDEGFNDDEFGFTSTTNSTNNHSDNFLSASIIGRQEGIDVVKELKTICLEHEKNSPVDNLAIELNGFKFSQNATYYDCILGATLAIIEQMDLTEHTTPGMLIKELKSALHHWRPLFQKLCQGLDEERAIITAFESNAVAHTPNNSNASNNDVIRTLLSKEPAFRFVLQTLHDEDYVSEEAIKKWAADRLNDEEDDESNPLVVLFLQKPTQDFLDWLDQSDSESGSSDDDDDGEFESDSD